MKAKLLLSGITLPWMLAGCLSTPDSSSDGLHATEITLGCDSRYTSCAEPQKSTEVSQLSAQKNTITESTSEVPISAPSTSLVKSLPVISPKTSITPSPKTVSLPQSQTFLFGFRQTQIDPVDLESQIDFLKQYSQVSVTLKGFADPIGDRMRNLEISKQRAQFIRAKLMDAGIDASRISIESFGETQLVQPFAPKAQSYSLQKLLAFYAPNRRVEMHFEHPTK